MDAARHRRELRTVAGIGRVSHGSYVELRLIGVVLALVVLPAVEVLVLAARWRDATPLRLTGQLRHRRPGRPSIPRVGGKGCNKEASAPEDVP